MALREVLFVTGTRADYGKIEPLATEACRLGHGVSFFITGMHMLKRYGETRLEVRRFPKADFYEYINHAHGDAQETVLAKTMLGFSDWLDEHLPDLVVVHGDRVEALAVALVCSTRYVPIAHVEGGEISGTIDEVYRHCITKLCRYHFVSSESAWRRVRALGEAAEDIFVIGSPELDIHAAESFVPLDEVLRRYEIPFDDYGIALFHPITSELDTLSDQAHKLFRTLTNSGRNFVVILPNNDPGAELILREIADLPRSRFRVLPSMRFSYFSALMKNSAVVVGNSSVGVREAPFLGIPSLNIGTRQSNRSASPAVRHLAAWDEASIAESLMSMWGMRYPRDSSFGEGRAAQRFGEVITAADFWNRSRQKAFVDLGTV